MRYSIYRLLFVSVSECTSVPTGSGFATYPDCAQADPWCEEGGRGWRPTWTAAAAPPTASGRSTTRMRMLPGSPTPRPRTGMGAQWPTCPGGRLLLRPMGRHIRHMGRLLWDWRACPPFRLGGRAMPTVQKTTLGLHFLPFSLAIPGTALASRLGKG